MIYCSCKSCAVDGGHDYIRRIYDEDDPTEMFEELSEYETLGGGVNRGRNSC